MIKNEINIFIIVALVTLLGCGGGGGGGGELRVADEPSASNEAPVIEDIATKTVKERESFSFESKSSDPDGEITQHFWTQVSGTEISLITNSSATLEFTAPSVVEDETLIFELTVTDDQNSSTTAEVEVVVSAYVLIEDVVFTDVNLKSCIDEQVQSNGWVNVSDVENVVCKSSQIIDITELTDYINLTQLDLEDNNIVDISVLPSLLQLQILNMSSNYFSDISPVFTLGNLTSVDFRNNPNIGCVSYNAIDEALSSSVSIQLPLDCAHILLKGQKAQYSREETITINVQGSNDEGIVLESTDGWHVQYSIYNMEEPDRSLSFYTSNGYYNAQFDEQKKEWVISYPAVDYSGNFRTRIALYCSSGDSICGGVFSEEQWEIDFYFEVTCPEGEDCSFMPEPEPGSNVSNSRDYSDSASIVKRANGELVVVYSEFGDVVENIVSRSTDDGETWEVLSNLGYSNDNDITETSAGELFLIQKCTLSICIYRSDDGSSWSQHDLFSESNFNDCNVNGCDINTYSVNSIIETQDQEYLVSYSHDANDGNKFDVYVTKSSDLMTWSTPVRVSNGNEHDFDSSLLVKPDGSFLLAYVSYTEQAIIVKSSSDGENWTENFNFATSTHLSMDVNLIMDADKPRLFFSNFENLYSSYQDAQNQFGTPSIVLENTPYGADAVSLANDNVGLVYALDLNEQRDVFFENIGVITD